MNDLRRQTPPSPWVVRFAPLIADTGPVLDLACGSGRHARYLAERGHKVAALDRNAEALAPLEDLTGVEIVAADLENGNPWPLAGRRFAGIIVTNYLHRPLFPAIIESLADKGILIYETFSLGNEAFGKPSNPDFLLRPGELLEIVHGSLRIVAFEEGIIDTPRPAVVQRICAVKSSTASALPLPLP
ncbi:MAG: methyltransferase domain-containing protein [Proteobacteria bacterium]|nr:methyltransferase domain-containing protein [Pseudomonadota bacterium]